MWTEEKLNQILTEPSEKLINGIKKIDGDITVLGASGKMGPTLCLLAKNAINKAGINKRIIAVARFTDKDSERFLNNNGIETITCDLADTEQIKKLPPTENIIYMAGRKFGTSGAEYLTWAMNAAVPAYVVDKYRGANYVVFSSGNLYPYVAPFTGGNSENVAPVPIGEYAMSTLARERVFEYAAYTYGAKIFMYRLNYAIDLRYGVLYDIAQNILAGNPVSLTVPAFNFVWQGYANEIAILGLLHTENPPKVVNITGPEVVSVRKAAEILSEYLGKVPIFSGAEGELALLSDASLCAELFGYPSVTRNDIIRWQAEWIMDGGRGLGKPTHFEERQGNY
ncbi:MAG: NAD-dependent epimerase/dehydratase [Oscillospiraceae bacterium]|nr:NAD-dependent epimerase/dehydratase [Oscillospiraceae bacterium]